MEIKNVKIAFSGPSGLGKSLLCKHVSNTLGISWLSTSAWDILSLDMKQDLKRRFGYKGTGHREVINLSSANPDFGMTFQSYVLESRLNQIRNANTPFVIDRSPIDNVAYMLSQTSHNSSDKQIAGFIKRAQEGYSKLTHIIQIRYSNDIPFIEDNGSRIPNSYFQRYISDVFLGVYSRYFANISGPRVITLDYWDLSERKHRVDGFLSGIQLDLF